MKLLNIIQSQAIKLGKVSGPGGGSIYGLNLSKACEERYGFLQAPRTLADYDLDRGITFLHGYFANFVVDRLQVFANGILAEAKVDTDECERFLEDLLIWVTERGGVQFSQSEPISRLFLSQIEVQTDIALGSSFSKFVPLGQQIGEILRGYGQVTPDYQVAGIAFGHLWNDTLGFKFEGREGAGVTFGTFFSQSRLRTADHMQVLKSLEALLTTTAS